MLTWISCILVQETKEPRHDSVTSIVFTEETIDRLEVSQIDEDCIDSIDYSEENEIGD